MHEALSAGHSVVATSRKPESLQEELNGKYDAETLKRVLAIKLDVTQPDDVKAAFAKAIEKFGRVDIVVNNAGYVSLLLSRVYEIKSRLITSGTDRRRRSGALSS